MAASMVQSPFSPHINMAKQSRRKDTECITHFFSQSPHKKNKRNIEDLERANQENVESKRIKHLSSASSRSKPFQSNAQEGTGTCIGSFDDVLGLLKIVSSTDNPKRLSAKLGDAKPLILGSILGRNLGSVPVFASRKRNYKVDLQITMDNGGSCISRKQLIVKSMTPTSFKIQQPNNVINETVHIVKYNAITRSMSRSFIQLKRGASVELVPGDVIEFDAWSLIDGQPTRNPAPLHVFRVVRLQTLSKNTKPAAMALQNPQEINLVDLCSPSRSPLKTTEVTRHIVRSDPTMPQPTKRQIGYMSPSKEEKTTAKTLLHEDIMVDICDSQHSVHVIANVEVSPSIPATPCKPRLVSTQMMAVKKVHDSSTDAKTSSVDPAFSMVPLIKNAVRTLTSDFDNEQAAKSLPIEHVDIVSPTRCRNPVAREESMVPDFVDELKPKSKQLVMPTPKVGDSLRVAFKCADIFGREIEQWYFGTCVKVVQLCQNKNVQSATHQVTVQFDDKITDLFEYPADDNSIQIIKLDTASHCARSLFIDSTTGEVSKGEIAYDGNPSKLCIGDLVDAKYQDGMGSPGDGKWFRGRIADVDALMNTAIIAYNDGDVEYVVPIKAGKIRLVTRGYGDTDWLEHVRVDTTRGKGAKKTPKGTISIQENRFGAVSERGLKIKVMFADDRSTVFPYVQIVKWLFADYLESTAPANKFIWPDGTVAKPNIQKPAQMKASPTREEIENGFLEPDQQEYHLQRMRNPETLSCLHPSISNSFFRALDSSEPHIGELFLAHMATLHRRGPTSKTGQDILMLLLNGPRSEGTLFPDPNRLDHARKYIHLMMSNAAMAHALLESIPVSSWEDLRRYLMNLNSRAYQVEGDEVATNMRALERVQHSLHLAAVTAEALRTFIEFELKNFVLADKKPMKPSYRSGRIVKALLENPNGIRDSLKMVTKICITAWIESSHFILFDKVQAKRRNNSSREYSEYESVPKYIKDYCFNNAKSLMASLGKILSYVAWISCAEVGVGMDDQNLALDIKNIVNNEIDTTSFDPSPFLRESGVKCLQKHYTELKKEIVFSLDDTFAGKLQSNLAEKLKIGQEYALITSW